MPKINLKKSAPVVDVVKNENAMEEKEMQDVKNNVVVDDVKTPAGAPVVDENGKADEKPERVQPVKSVPENDVLTKKERAKINPTALDIKTIIENCLAPFLAEVVKSLGERADAEQLAKAKLYGAGYEIFNQLAQEVEKRYKDYAKRSYMNSFDYQVWNNTRKAGEKEQAGFEIDLSKLIGATDTDVYALLENNDVIVRQTAQDVVKKFLPHYIINCTVNLAEQIREIKNAGLKVVQIKEYVIKSKPAIMGDLMQAGYVLKAIENVPARDYADINKHFDGVENLYRFEKA